LGALVLEGRGAHRRCCRRGCPEPGSHFPAATRTTLVLTLDSAYEYTDADLAHWDADGPDSTFRKYYPEYYDLALSHGLDLALKPTRLDISETVRWLGYKPSYSLANLLSELAAHGDSGPPQPAEA
jgi:hypothetical protein